MLKGSLFFQRHSFIQILDGKKSSARYHKFPGDSFKPSQGKFEIFAEDETSFFAKVTALKVKFNKDTAGEIESFTLYQGGQETIAKKIE